MTDGTRASVRVRWARLRFSIIGALLHSPPASGELGARIAELAALPWEHPTTGEVVRFSAKAIERWYYIARSSPNPIEALARKVPSHAGTFLSLSESLAEMIEAQYRAHPRWSYQLHYDNLLVVVRERPELGKMPGYATVCRFMKSRGMHRQKRRRRRMDELREERERRTFEVQHVHGLWHLDFHECSRSVLTAAAEWRKPQLLGILDDCSRLCCHLQWYLDETTESLVHGLCQAIQKRGLPRALLSDNGSAMLAAETVEGLERLSIRHYTTLAETPEQNGKQEAFWAPVEGRLMAMLEGEPELTLELLNRATQAWVEQEYHRKLHRELGKPPLERYLEGPSVGRQSPSSETLRRAFRMEVTRAQRRSDGTITVEGVRYEVPWTYRTLGRVSVRVARWDLSSVELVDRRTGTHLATLLPIDKAKNADRRRRAVDMGPPRAPTPPVGIAPRLRALMAEYAATGLPPAYLPKDEHSSEENEES